MCAAPIPLPGVFRDPESSLAPPLFFQGYYQELIEVERKREEEEILVGAEEEKMRIEQPGRG